MDAITLLKADHKTVAHLFARFEKAGDRAHVEKRELVDRMVEELSAHAAIEEQLFYPVVRATVPGVEDIALESLEEHHIVKWTLAELQDMAPTEERFVAKVTVLIENVRHHVKEEEAKFFPMVRDALGRQALADLGVAMEAAKKSAPTHSHPRAPDTPPGNLVMGAAAGVADRIGDTVNGLAQGGVSALGDIIATVLGRQRPRVSPTGARAMRRTASKVRANASDATEAAIAAKRKAKRTAHATGSSAKAGATRTARAARQGGTSTASTAKAGAKGTATSVRTSTKRAVTTAKRGATTTRRAARAGAKGTATTARRSAARTVSTAKRSARAA